MTPAQKPALLALPEGFNAQVCCPLDVAHYLYREGFRVMSYDNNRTVMEANRMERNEQPYTLSYTCGVTGGHMIKTVWTMGKPYSGVVFSGANIKSVEFARMLLCHVANPDCITFFDDEQYTAYVQEVIAEYFDIDQDCIAVEPFIVSESVEVWVCLDIEGVLPLRKTYTLVGAPELCLDLIKDLSALVYEG